MGHPIGMFNSLDQSKTESWIDLAGGLLRVGVLRCEVIIFPYLHLMALRFLGSWCSVQKSPLGFCLIFLDCCSREDFIYRQSPKERYYYNGLVLHVKKVWGVNGSSSSSLSYLLRVMDNGLLFIWTLCLQLGRVILVGIETLHFGRRYHIASCGVFGENEMLEVLRDVNNLSLKLKPFFLRTSLDSSVAFHSPQKKIKK